MTKVFEKMLSEKYGMRALLTHPNKSMSGNRCELNIPIIIFRFVGADFPITLELSSMFLEEARRGMKAWVWFFFEEVFNFFL
jgi:hypothetical protein